MASRIAAPLGPTKESRRKEKMQDFWKRLKPTNLEVKDASTNELNGEPENNIPFFFQNHNYYYKKKKKRKGGGSRKTGKGKKRGKKRREEEEEKRKKGKRRQRKEGK